MTTPLFSVIVPTYNRCSSLKRTLKSLFSLDYASWELIVVNDGSTDETDSFLTGLSEQHSFIYIKQENRGPASARNAGIQHAQGIYIAFTDDDCTVPLHWLRSFEQAFHETNADIIGGLARNCITSNVFSELSQEMTNYFTIKSSMLPQQPTFLPSNNIAYKSVPLKTVGGFDVRFRKAGGEERALHCKIVSNGGTSVLLGSLFVDHYHALTLKTFINQQQNYGRGAFMLYKTTDTIAHAISPSIPLFTYVRFAGYLLSKSFGRGTMISLLFIYAQIMVMIGYTKEAITHGKNTFNVKP